MKTQWFQPVFFYPFFGFSFDFQGVRIQIFGGGGRGVGCKFSKIKLKKIAVKQPFLDIFKF